MRYRCSIALNICMPAQHAFKMRSLTPCTAKTTADSNAISHMQASTAGVHCARRARPRARPREWRATLRRARCSRPPPCACPTRTATRPRAAPTCARYVYSNTVDLYCRWPHDACGTRCSLQGLQHCAPFLGTNIVLSPSFSLSYLFPNLLLSNSLSPKKQNTNDAS
jgi:hypothetical protein